VRLAPVSSRGVQAVATSATRRTASNGLMR
jgi:hypothetical protein